MVSCRPRGVRSAHLKSNYPIKAHYVSLHFPPASSSVVSVPLIPSHAGQLTSYFFIPPDAAFFHPERITYGGNKRALRASFLHPLPPQNTNTHHLRLSHGFCLQKSPKHGRLLSLQTKWQASSTPSPTPIKNRAFAPICRTIFVPPDEAYFSPSLFMYGGF